MTAGQLFDYGYSLIKGERFAEAVAPLRQSAILKRSWQALSHLGVALWKTGDLEGAIGSYRQALAIHSHPEVAVNLCIALKEIGRHEEVIELFRSTDLRKLPLAMVVDAHLAVAFSILALGRFPEAWPHYEARHLIDVDLSAHRREILDAIAPTEYHIAITL